MIKQLFYNEVNRILSEVSTYNLISSINSNSI